MNSKLGIVPYSKKQVFIVLPEAKGNTIFTEVQHFDEATNKRNNSGSDSWVVIIDKWPSGCLS